MNRRLDLQTLLEELTENDHVYFQPPASVRMKYPAIRYSLNNIENTHANNNIYRQQKSYTLTVIDSDPDSVIVDKVSKLPRCRFNRSYTADGLNHSVFTLYF